MEQEKPYEGFWQKLGCTLSVIAILGILVVFALGIYFFTRGF